MAWQVSYDNSLESMSRLVRPSERVGLKATLLSQAVRDIGESHDLACLAFFDSLGFSRL